MSKNKIFISILISQKFIPYKTVNACLKFSYFCKFNSENNAMLRNVICF